LMVRSKKIVKQKKEKGQWLDFTFLGKSTHLP
jgi:hypothetical protein